MLPWEQTVPHARLPELERPETESWQSGVHEVSGTELPLPPVTSPDQAGDL